MVGLLDFMTRQVFKSRATPEALEMIAKLLEYTPTARFTAVEAMTHTFFDELRLPETKLASGNNLPPLFNFTALELSIRPDLLSKLVPAHAESELLSRGIDVHNFTPIPIQVTQLPDN